MWPDGKILCPRCGSESVRYSAKHRRWQCGSHHERRQFTLKTGTIFEDSPLGLDKWLVAMWILVNSKNGVSSWEVSRTLGVTQKSAWFMMHRLRNALQQGSLVKLDGSGAPIEVDETFIGGKARNMHRDRRARCIQGTGGNSKTIVMGMLQRGGKVKAVIAPDRKRSTVQQIVRDYVEPGSEIHTDEHAGYQGLDKDYVHEVINHMEAYVRGHVSTNGMENFWSLFKRQLGGTHVSVEPFHLFRYLDEEMFRYNYRRDGERKLTNSDRFNLILSQIAGKRLTYKEVTGKVGETAF